jgi:hypothetical protein
MSSVAEGLMFIEVLNSGNMLRARDMIHHADNEQGFIFYFKHIDYAIYNPTNFSITIK